MLTLLLQGLVTHKKAKTTKNISLIILAS